MSFPSAGQITDDGELAIGLLTALAAAPRIAPTFPMDAIAQQYRNWYCSRPFDIGATCARAFSVSAVSSAADMVSVRLLPVQATPAASTSPLHTPMFVLLQVAVAARQSAGSQANGSLMRIAPLAIWAHARGLPAAQLAAFARQEATLSHPSPVCQDCNACYVVAMAWLLGHPGDAAGAVAQVDAVCQPLAAEVHGWLQDSAQEDCLQQLQCHTNIGHVRCVSACHTPRVVTRH